MLFSINHSYLISVRPRGGRLTNGSNIPGILPPTNSGNGVPNGVNPREKSSGPKSFRFGLNQNLTTGNNDYPSNFHSEPALNRKAVHFSSRLNKSDTSAAHSSGDLQKEAKNGKKTPGFQGINKKKGLANSSSDSAEGLQNGVLRISAPFLNNPLVHHINQK